MTPPPGTESPVRFEKLIRRWRDDEGGTYRTWFLWEERLKNFRSIRRGISVVVSEIAASTFGSAYRGSSLEVIVGSVAEQRQIFRGADHAFLWKPKLRIPDIYENQENQRAFGRFLDVCLCCATETEIVAAIHELASKAIKGLGPAAANLLYFLHPTHALPFNTAIGKGYNALTGANVKLLIEVRSHKPRMQPEKALARMRELSVDSGCLAALESLVADGMRVDPL